METNLLLQKNAIIILSKMITIEKRHFRSKQDFHLELSPIGNLKSFMSGPPVAKETLVLISTIHRCVAQLGLTISTIHRRVAQLGLTISTIHRRVAHKELRKQKRHILIFCEFFFRPMKMYFSGSHHRVTLLQEHQSQGCVT